MEEIWKDIVGYEGLYQISNFGKVKSLKRINVNIYREKRLIHERILSFNNIKGYRSVSLKNKGIENKYQIHRLVAIHFIDNPNNFELVHHIDGNTKNNIVDNLQWIGYAKHNRLHKLNNNYSGKSVSVYFEDELINTFQSRRAAAKWRRVSDRSIKYYIDGRKDPKGYIWI